MSNSEGIVLEKDLSRITSEADVSGEVLSSQRYLRLVGLRSYASALLSQCKKRKSTKDLVDPIADNLTLNLDLQFILACSI